MSAKHVHTVGSILQQPGPACVWDGDTEGSGSSSRACWGSFENTAKLFNIFPDSGKQKHCSDIHYALLYWRISATPVCPEMITRNIVLSESHIDFATFVGLIKSLLA